MSIRTKIALLMTILLAIVSLAIYSYFPRRLHQQIVGAVAQKAAAMTGMAAFAVGDGLQAGNRAAVSAALTGVRANPDLAYLLLVDERGQVFASYNELMAREAAFDRVTMKPVEVAQRALVAGKDARSPVQGLVGGVTGDGAIYQSMSPVRYRGRVIGRLYTGMSLSGANADAARSRATIAVVTLIAFLLGTAAVFGLSTLITGPLKRIAATSEDIAAGDFTRRADVKSDDEVGQLARAFNGMVDHVTDLNRTLEARVEERTHELRVSEERYRLLFERNLAGVYVASEDGRIIDCNDACARLFRHDSRQQLIGGAIEYVHPHHRDSIIRRLRESGAVINEEVELRARDGSTVWALENIRRVVREGEAPVLEGILLDVTDRKRAEEEIAFKAYHDALTGLPNRTLFLDRLSIALAHARRNGSRLAVFFLDLDDMKSINDTFGHAIGDRVLKAVGGRLLEALRADDTVARVGGDEFLILLEVQDPQEAEALAKRVLARVTEPLAVDRDELYVTTSIGAAIFPDDGEDADALIRHADGAMYRVKETGGNNVQLSSREARRAVGRLSLEEQIRAAFDHDEFVLHYQPQVQLTTRALSGAEALVRWQRPDGTLLPPSAFLPVCEQSGLITELGEVVLRKACEQMVEWQTQGSAPPRMGVNVSARQFYQRDFAGVVDRVLAATGLPPLRLELEITETVAMQTTDRSLSVLHHFREMGISIAVDDFGTGQSSLSYLKRFPVDTVKIDRSFVQDIISGANDEWIITAVLMLANHLGLRTVAEGVESEIQCTFLRGHDCREIQGYLIAKPLPPGEFAERFLPKRAEARVPRAARI